MWSSFSLACTSHAPPPGPDSVARTSGAASGACRPDAAKASGSQLSKKAATVVPAGGRSQRLMAEERLYSADFLTVNPMPTRRPDSVFVRRGPGLDVT